MVERLSVAQHVDGDAASPRDVSEPAKLPPIADYFRWGYEQAALIRDGRFDLLDVLNVADEIEAVARSELRAMRSNLEVVLLHLLKWKHQPARRSRSWINSIEQHRERIESDLEDNRSMAVKWDETVAKAYRVARAAAARQTNLELRVLPETCPFSRDDIMTVSYRID